MLGCDDVESVPDNVVADIDPAVTCPTTPTPPETIKAPVETDVDVLVATIDTIPEKVGDNATEKADPLKVKFVPAV